MIQLDIRSRSWIKKIRLRQRLLVFLGIQLRIHPKTYDSLRLRHPLPNPGFNTEFQMKNQSFSQSQREAFSYVQMLSSCLCIQLNNWFSRTLILKDKCEVGAMVKFWALRSFDKLYFS